MADTGYTWSTLYFGGKTQEGRDGRTLVIERNSIPPGTKVAKSDLKSKYKLTDEEWDQMVEGGSIRSYPLPKMPEGYGGSPAEFVLSQLRGGETDIKTDVLLGLALKHPDYPESEALSEAG